MNKRDAKDIAQFIEQVLDEEGEAATYENGTSANNQLDEDERLIQDTIVSAAAAMATSDTTTDVPHTGEVVTKMPVVEDVSFALEMYSRSLRSPRELLDDDQRNMLEKIRAKYKSMM